MKESIAASKSVSFAMKIVNVYKLLCIEKKEFVLSKQLLKSGTAVGALIREAEHAESKADFLHKMNIALKEANETEYWLLLLSEGDYLNKELYTELGNECNELIRLLARIVKTTKTNLGR